MYNNQKPRLHALPQQSTQELDELHQKIRIHRIRIIILALALASVCIIAVNVVILYLDRITYTKYEVVEQLQQADTEAAEFEQYCGNVLKYTRDGAVCSSLSGSIIWNQTYEMETPCITICEEYLAIYEKGGSQIYIMNTEGLQGTINTIIPIQCVSVANQGTVAVLMEKSGTSYLHMYSRSGKQLASGELHIENSGYPLDIALSNDAQKLAVSMLDINEGNVKSAVVFYNYGAVGQNEIDNIVGSYSYSNMVIPSIRFVSNDRLLAFGDTEVIIYEGKQKPAVAQEINISEEIRSIYYNDQYFGLVFNKEASAKGYHTTVYNMKGTEVLELDFALDYTKIHFLANNLICIRNENQCVLYTLKGSKRFSYTFDRNIYEIMSGNGQRDYLFILNGETSRVKLTNE